jgi:hypothetical protein
MPDLDTSDARRLGFLVLTVTDLSSGRYVLLRYSDAAREWRVNVRAREVEYVATSGTSLVLALERAWQWLQAEHTEERIRTL